LRATPMVVGQLAMVPPGDSFLRPIPDGRGSYERGSRIRSFIGWNFIQLECIINLSTWTQ